MGEESAKRAGYKRVDDRADAATLLAGMDATAGWAATKQLRSWERDQLGLTAGQRLLDVGCGLGDAGLALARDLGDGGELLGVDASSQMIEAARSRAHDAPCRVRFVVGDATKIDEPDDTFDAARSERVLQWLADPGAAVREMARLVRGGGVVSLIDSDWSTLLVDIGDADTTRRVAEAMAVERSRPSNIGGRLADLVVSCGLEPFAHTSATHTWSRWDPDESPMPDGFFPMAGLARHLIDAGTLAADARVHFVEKIHEAARAGRFSMALTMFAVAARVPSRGRGASAVMTALTT